MTITISPYIYANAREHQHNISRSPLHSFSLSVNKPLRSRLNLICQNVINTKLQN